MRAVFAEIVDYAGLFPPATSTMVEAVGHFRDYRNSADQWMLGRFVVTASRLPELASTIAQLPTSASVAAPWRVTAVMGTAIAEELARIEDFNGRWAAKGILVDSVECRASTPSQVSAIGAAIPSSYRRHLEVPIAGPYDDLVLAMKDACLFAKVRTGGVVPELFPAPTDLMAFLAAVTRAAVPFKATAGLHHPIRGEYRLTYAPDAPRGLMYGFVNLLLATALLVRGEPAGQAQALLVDSDARHFTRDPAGMVWSDQHFTVEELAATRASAFLGFGSCSFREPVDELQQRGLA